jgi:alkylation response protein AidB-like acyl-CoA dehydrogenase
MPMLIELPDEYYDLQATVERVLGDHADALTLRRYWDGGPPQASELWPRLAELGLADLMLPTSYGGEELPLLAAVPLLESFGKFAVPQPVAETIAIVAPALAAELDRSDVRQWHRELAAGERMATVQFGWDGHAPWAADAGLALVVVDDDVYICETDSETVELLDGIDPSRRVGRIGTAAKRAALQARGAAAAVHRRALLANAATLFGLAEAVIEQSVEYAKVRQQFGREIGSFQAVKHMLADTYTEWEFSRRYLWFAAWADANDDPRALPAAVQAKALAGEVATKASYTGLQVHGGIGYTWDCDLHMWLTRIQILDAAHGSSDVQWRWLIENGQASIEDAQEPSSVRFSPSGAA